MLRTLLFTLVVQTLLTPAVVLACTPNWRIAESLPANGTVAVPTNAILFVEAMTLTEVQATVHHSNRTTTTAPERVNDAPLYLPYHLWRVPLGALTAGSTVTVDLQGDQPGFGRTSTRTVGFTAGAADDTTAPTPPGAPQLNWRVKSVDSCYPNGGYEISAGFAPSTDDVAVAAYALVRTDSGAGTRALDARLDGNRLVGYLGTSETRACFKIVAYDLAANASESGESCVDLMGGRASDAGPTMDAAGDRDAGVGSDALTSVDAGTRGSTPSPAAEPGGCNTTGPGALWPLVLLFVLWPPKRALGKRS